MTDGPPPPLPADGPPPPRAAPPRPSDAPAAGPSPSDAARAGAGARSAVAWSVGCTVLLCVMCGSGVLVGGRLIDERADREQRKVESVQAELALRGEAELLLDTLAEDLLAGARELPPTLPESPPRDPWGHAIRYLRRTSRTGVLTSAGGDGAFGTRDDVVRALKIE